MHLHGRASAELSGSKNREGSVIPSTWREGERELQTRQRDASRAWDCAGVRADVCECEPFHAFRYGSEKNMLALGAHPDAGDHLPGHKLERGSGTATSTCGGRSRWRRRPRKCRPSARSRTRWWGRRGRGPAGSTG